ncbi:hypothetical protein HRI_002319200 [Hibiscus trionum]|uniref:Endonuclease/exonuclease/phosphatase domain-containing protein n=1 Tax=Hibiscus trionum TaxID=183268 RepID=A0A9W7HZH8_HIBTR|nr:hypothetical protein HRI_002319200 [Hibiscus trionum]
MSILSWNIRGLSKSEKVRALKDSLFKFKLGIVFLSETKKKSSYLEKLRTKSIFSGSYYVDPRGLTSGLALWWTEDINMTILKESQNFIDTQISLKGGTPWYCTFLYGPPHKEDKQAFLVEALIP